MFLGLRLFQCLYVSEYKQIQLRIYKRYILLKSAYTRVYKSVFGCICNYLYLCVYVITYACSVLATRI